jgi:hypothetical protein
LVCMLLQDRGPKSHAPPHTRKARRFNAVRLTQPNFMSSHDWHVQLCCQRSYLHTPRRAVLDQGPTPGRCPGFVSSNLIALCWTGEVSGWLLPASASDALPFTGLAAVFCANFLMLQKDGLHVNHKRSKCQNNENDSKSSRGTWAPIALLSLSSPGMLHVQWLGFGAVGSVSFRRPVYRGQTLGLRSGLPSSPASNFQQAPARSLYYFNSLRVQH